MLPFVCCRSTCYLLHVNKREKQQHENFSITRVNCLMENRKLNFPIFRHSLSTPQLTVDAITTNFSHFMKVLESLIQTWHSFEGAILASFYSNFSLFPDGEDSLDCNLRHFEVGKLETHLHSSVDSNSTMFRLFLALLCTVKIANNFENLPTFLLARMKTKLWTWRRHETSTLINFLRWTH